MTIFQWFNEPKEWELKDDASISMFITPCTDFWRKTPYGLTVDDGPFYYSPVEGEFEASVRITGGNRTRFDQMEGK